jgi:putative ABC transport system permease protein
VILLIASGLLIRALHRVQSIDPGFKVRNVLTMETRLPLPKYGKTLTRIDFYTRVLEGIRALPGVRSAAYITHLPMVMRGGIWNVQGVDGRNFRPGEGPLASIRFVSPGFFDSLSIPIRAGRDIRDSDASDGQAVAVISESLAQKLWPNQDAIGKHFKFAFQERTIIGIVGDIRFRGLERSSEPQVYLPYRQVADNAIIGYVPKALVVRSNVDSGILMSSIRSIIAKADPEIPISNIRMLQDILDDETLARRTQIRIIVAFATLSLLLAGIGIHGLLAFSVSQKTSEIGLRLALGATSRDILKMVVQKGFQIALWGTLIGVVFAYIAGRLMQALLAGVAPADPVTLFIVCALAFLATISGCLLPAIRALRIDPAFAIRVE